MYNEKSELDEELKRVMNEEKDVMSEEIIQAVEQDHAVWLDEQTLASKAVGKMRMQTDDLAKQAYTEAAEKTIKAKLDAIVLIAQVLADMEDTRDAIRKEIFRDIPLSGYLDRLTTKMKDSLEFGIARSEKEALMKRYCDDFTNIKEEAHDRMQENCYKSLVRQDIKAKKMEAVAPFVDPQTAIEEVAWEAYSDGAYNFMAEVIKLNNIVTVLLNEMESKKNAIRSGAVADSPVSAYVGEKISLLKECMRSEGIKENTYKAKAMA